MYWDAQLIKCGPHHTLCMQVVIPHLTENYGATKDPPEKEAPQCAIHNFPHNIDHCLVSSGVTYLPP